MKRTYFAAIILAAVVTLFFVIRNSATTDKNIEQTPLATETALNNLEPQTPPNNKLYAGQTNNEGTVTITVRPKNISGDKEWDFEIVLDTHSTELNEDLAKTSVLIDNENNKYYPFEWRGGSGGHHLSGNLIFPPLSEESKAMKLVISELYGVKERIFEWDLK